MRKIGFILWLMIFFWLAGCVSPGGAGEPPAQTPPSESTRTSALPQNSTPTGTPEPTSTPKPTRTPEPTLTLTPTPTPTPTVTPTPSITPTYAVLRGKVIIDQLSCRFGPGVMYLFKYSVFKEAVLEIIGRMELSSWILVQAVGGSNPCWVNGKYIEVRGDIQAVAPVDPHEVLAWSPYYDALTAVSAVRDGDVVTVFWSPLVLRAGDDSGQIPFVVEAWVCVDREITFAPVGAYSHAAEVIDEPGCDQPSYVRVFAAEKHGYTQWRVVPWPQVNPEPSATP